MEHPDYVRLVELARNGDMDAFTALVRDFQDLVMATAYGWLGEVEAARDVSQETFLDAYVNLRQLREPAAFPGWLRRIVHKHCDRITRRLRPEAVALDEGFVAAADGFESAIDTTDGERRLRAAVASLPANERMVVSLHYFAGLTGPELAAFLDVSLSVVKKRLHSARAHLREQGERLMEQTVEQIRPSTTRTFAEVVTFFLAIRAGDRARVKDMLERSPPLANAVQEWDSALVTDGVLPFASRATALITAIERDDLPLLELLLNAGADVDGKCHCATGESPVWAATVLDRRRHLRALLERGSDPNRLSCTGNASLHVAAMRGLRPTVELLLAHGANREILDAGARSPADWARANGHLQVAAMLECGDDSATPTVTRGGQQSAAASAQVLFTGIKALDLFCPIPRGGLVRFPFMAGVGLVVLVGELCRRITLSPTGRALWTGFSQRPFDLKDWQAEMAELGIADCVRQSLADLDASPEARREAYRRGLDLAESMTNTGSDVLLVVMSDPEFESDVEESFARLAAPRSTGSITTIHVTAFPEHDDAALPRLRAPYDAQLKLHRSRARRGIYPAIDPMLSMSRALGDAGAGAEHVRIAELARAALAGYTARDPEFAAFAPGGVAADPHFAGRGPKPATEAGGQDPAALRLTRYLAQPFYVAEPFSGRPGEWVGQAELLEAVEAILSL